jgi:hypothetical protein
MISESEQVQVNGQFELARRIIRTTDTLGSRKGVWDQLTSENTGMWEKEVAELCREMQTEGPRNLCATANVIMVTK